ncbi:hypothetical protein SLS62_002720 [Diatrype stigma]|uniref:Uncharacterized protein n=1 Tax=Diatrype stigma TaxID=117547 RepID=A0AAN9UZK6_9PEZI
MAKRLISSGSAFESAIGYSRAVVSGDWVFVSGCTGYDYATNSLPEDVVEQAEQCMRNIAAALAEAATGDYDDGENNYEVSVDDVVRVRYILPDRRDFPRVWPVLRRWFGGESARPAATMIQAGLMEEAMKIEIEVTARMRRTGPRDGNGIGSDNLAGEGGRAVGPP